LNTLLRCNTSQAVVLEQRYFNPGPGQGLNIENLMKFSLLDLPRTYVIIQRTQAGGFFVVDYQLLAHEKARRASPIANLQFACLSGLGVAMGDQKP